MKTEVFVLIFGFIFLLFLIDLGLEKMRIKSANRTLELMTNLQEKFYKMGSDLKKSGKPYQSPWENARLKGSLSKSVAPYLIASHKEGYEKTA